MSNLVLDKYLGNLKKNERAPKHEISAMVDEIIKVTGVDKNYPYSFWCRKVKQSHKCFFQVYDICKEAEDLPDKYSRGGYITNRLCNKPKKQSNLNQLIQSFQSQSLIR
jgi:hypothetical protein